MNVLNIARFRVGSVALLAILAVLPAVTLAAASDDIDQVFTVQPGGMLIVTAMPARLMWRPGIVMKYESGYAIPMVLK